MYSFAPGRVSTIDERLLVFHVLVHDCAGLVPTLNRSLPYQVPGRDSLHAYDDHVDMRVTLTARRDGWPMK